MVCRPPGIANHPQRPRGRLRVLPALAAALAATPAAAQEVGEEGRIPGLPESSIASSLPPGLADPGGIRAALAGRGVTFVINYIGEVLANPTGGFAQGTFYDGRLDLELRVDLDKLIGWR